MMTNERTRERRRPQQQRILKERQSLARSLGSIRSLARPLAHYDGAVIHGEIEALGMSNKGDNLSNQPPL